MPLRIDQYVNIHAHRTAVSADEWVLSNIRVQDYPTGKRSNAFYSVGLHPWDVEDQDMSLPMKVIRDAVRDRQVFAIGEAGLDKRRGGTMKQQVNAFELQVEIAEIAGLPMIIHAVKCQQELVQFIKVNAPAASMVIHGFRGSRALADTYLEWGFYLSFGETLVHSDKLQQVFSSIPLDRVFLETDESLIPISTIYSAASKAMKTDSKDIREQIFRNASRILKSER